MINDHLHLNYQQHLQVPVQVSLMLSSQTRDEVNFAAMLRLRKVSGGLVVVVV